MPLEPAATIETNIDTIIRNETVKGGADKGEVSDLLVSILNRTRREFVRLPSGGSFDFIDNVNLATIQSGAFSLAFTLPASEIWKFHVILYMEPDAGADIVVQVTAPNSTGRFAIQNTENAGSAHTLINSESAVIQVSNQNDDAMEIIGDVGNATAADDLVEIQIRNGNNTDLQRVLDFSSIEAWPVA